MKDIIKNQLSKEKPFIDKKRYKFELNYYLETIPRAEKVIKIIEYFHKFNLKNKKVLDAASGAGGISIALAKRGADCTGIDLDSNRIKLAKQLSKNLKIKFLNQNLYNNPFLRNQFDYIFTIDFLEHVDTKKMTNQLMQYLKKDGTLIFKVNNFLFPYESHIKNFFIHFLPVKLIDIYLKKFYPDFFRHYQSYKEIKLPTYFKLRKILKKYNYQMYPIFYPFIPGKNKIMNKIFTSRIFLPFCQSFIVFCKHKTF